jgi:hypothetical protein
MAKRFQRRRFKKKSTNQSQELTVTPCLLTDRDKMTNPYRRPSIDAFHQVSLHLTKQFQRRRFFKINQSETRITCGGHVCKRIGTK